MPHSRLNWPVTLQDKPEWRLCRSTIGVKSSECSSVANGSSLTLQDSFSLAAKCDKTNASPIRGISAALSPVCLCLSPTSQVLCVRCRHTVVGAKALRGLADVFPCALYSSQAPKLYDSSCCPAAYLPSNLEGGCSVL